MGTEIWHGWKDPRHISDERPRAASHPLETGRGPGHAQAAIAKGSEPTAVLQDGQVSAKEGLDRPTEPFNSPRDKGNDRTTALSGLLEAQQEFRAKMSAVRRSTLSIQGDLQYQRQTCQQRRRSCYQTIHDLHQLFSDKETSTAGVEIASLVSQLDASFKDLISDSDALAVNEGKLRGQPDHLQRLESEEEEGFNGLVRSVGIDLPSHQDAPDHVKGNDIDMSEEFSQSSTTSNPMHPVLRDFYSKSGDVHVLLERLVDLEALQLEEVEAREVLRDQDQTPSISDEEFQRKQLLDIENLRQELETARAEMDLSRTLCQALGLDIGTHEPRAGSSAAEDGAETGSVAIYEAILPPNSIPSHVLVAAERVSSAGYTGHLEGSHSPIRRTSIEKVRTRKRIEEWMRDVESPPSASMPTNEDSAPSTQTLEAQISTTVQAVLSETAHRGAGAAQGSTQPGPANASKTPLTDRPIRQAMTNLTRGSELGHSVTPTISSTPESTAFAHKPHTALGHAKKQIKCPITKTLRSLTRRYKLRTLS